MEKINKKIVLGVAALAAAVFGAWKFIWEPSEQANTQSTTTPPVSEPTATIPPSATGEEMANVKRASVKTSYKNPGGEDEVGFNITVDESGTIVATSTDILAKNPTSIKRQEAFAAALPQVLQGKKISDLQNIDKVGGSSLTTASFNASLTDLKAGL